MSARPYHSPVMLREVLHFLGPRPRGIYLDATVGCGGHALAILHAATPRGVVVGMDQDPEALALSASRLKDFGDRFLPVKGNFRDFRSVLAARSMSRVDGILMDLGVSSLQLDTPQRGFSFLHDGPLDARMDPTGPVTAATLVNALSAPELKQVLYTYGEERRAAAIARAIVRRRADRPIETTSELAAIVERAVPASARPAKIHPATRTFQALRIAVNQELDNLAAALEAIPEALNPGGRAVVISFHSLEDRLVKTAFRRQAATCICPPGLPECRCGHVPTLRLLTPRPVRPDSEECRQNPRARSARLRAAERL